MAQVDYATATQLNLLTRDGAIAVEFSPALENRHYAELFDLVKEFDSEAMMRQLVRDAAQRWGRVVVFG
jgi:hypothetical protein